MTSDPTGDTHTTIGPIQQDHGAPVGPSAIADIRRVIHDSLPGGDGNLEGAVP